MAPSLHTGEQYPGMQSEIQVTIQKAVSVIERDQKFLLKIYFDRLAQLKRLLAIHLHENADVRLDYTRAIYKNMQDLLDAYHGYFQLLAIDNNEAAKEKYLKQETTQFKEIALLETINNLFLAKSLSLKPEVSKIIIDTMNKSNTLISKVSREKSMRELQSTLPIMHEELINTLSENNTPIVQCYERETLVSHLISLKQALLKQRRSQTFLSRFFNNHIDIQRIKKMEEVIKYLDSQSSNYLNKAEVDTMIQESLPKKHPTHKYFKLSDLVVSVSSSMKNELSAEEKLKTSCYHLPSIIDALTKLYKSNHHNYSLFPLTYEQALCKQLINGFKKMEQTYVSQTQMHYYIRSHLESALKRDKDKIHDKAIFNLNNNIAKIIKQMPVLIRYISETKSTVVKQM